MTKKEKQAEMFRDNINSCLRTTSAEYFTYGNIPVNRFNGAKRSYANNADYNETIGLVDTTLLGGGERGILVTTDGVYYKGMLEKPVFCSYEDLYMFKAPDDTYFNGINLKSMLYDMAEVKDDDKFADAVIGLAETFIEYAGEKYIQHLENEQKKEEEEALEDIIAFKNEIRDFKKELSMFIQDYDELETDDEAYEKIISILCLSYICTNKKEEFEEIAQADESFDEAAAKFEYWQDVLDDLIEDDEIEEISHIFKKFYLKMSSIYDAMINGIEDEETDWETWYENSQNAIKTVRKKLGKIVEYINEQIEDFDS